MSKDKEKNWFKRHKILTGVLIFVGFCIIVSALGGGSDSKKSDASKKSDTSTSKENSEAKTIGLNQPASDGKFEFTVTGITCGQTSVGSEYLTKTAQGQYCLLNLSVKNTGNEAQSLISSNQHLLNAQGQKYNADDTATLYNSPSNDASSWYSDVNPGNTVSGTIVFDVPKGQTPTTAELHDSAFSGGIQVKLQ